MAVTMERLEGELRLLETALEKVRNCEHEDLLDRFQTLDHARQQQLGALQFMSQQMQRNVDVIFEYECEEAEKEYVASCEKLKQDMLEEIRMEMERVHDQWKGGTGAGVSFKGSRKTTRITRNSKRYGENGGGSGVNSTANVLGDAAGNGNEASKKRLLTVFQPLEKTLEVSEIDADLRVLEAGAEEALAFRATSDGGCRGFLARYYRGKLLYKHVILQEGDAITYTKKSNATPVPAVICDITPAEVFVLTERGKYSRVNVQDLRLGFVTIEHVSDGSSSHNSGYPHADA